MIQCKPAFSYVLIIIIMIWLVLGIVAVGNASKWLQGSYATIQQDIIILPSNNNLINNDEAVLYEEWQYNKNLIIAANSPHPSGLKGMLYDGGISCNSTVNINNTNNINQLLPTYTIMTGNKKNNLAKIAIINNDGRCLYIDKLKNVQNQGASAVIIYDINIENNNNISRLKSELHLQPNVVFIPTYYVDHQTGIELISRLNNNTGWKSSLTKVNHHPNNDSNKIKNDTDSLLQQVNVITLYPNQDPLLQPWQFAIIIIGAVILISIFIFTFLQCRSYNSQYTNHRNVGLRGRRRRRRNQSGDSEDDDDGLELNGQELYWLHYLSNNEQEYAIHFTTQSNQQSSSWLLSNENKKTYKLQQSLVDTLPIKIWNNENDHHHQHSSCVICLENYVQNDILRILPCEHEYHRDCIDLWLTKKNSRCPLCLQYVISPTIPDQAHVLNTEQEDIEGSIENTWYNLSIREENRLHPLANLRNSRFQNESIQQDHMESNQNSVDNNDNNNSNSDDHLDNPYNSNNNSSNNV